jgi:hypothetical protein
MTRTARACAAKLGGSQDRQSGEWENGGVLPSEVAVALAAPLTFDGNRREDAIQDFNARCVAR